MPRNFIILNDIPSLQINGLLIQELPPITKPPVRFNALEIDGVDGDRVEQLGYGAYDKPVLIGLYNDFDIDQVISYFTGSGKVVFSNEPDKYYEYEILQQIDYARLMCFRTATVMFHVQPFKYNSGERRLSATDNVISLGDQTQSVGGLDVTVENNNVTVTGTNPYPAEIYLPIRPVILGDKSYTLTVHAQGPGMNQIAVRLLHGSPIDEHTFGGRELSLAEGGVSISGNGDGVKFTTLYIYAPPQTAYFSLFVKIDPDDSSCTVRNTGNTAAKPIYTVHGYGDIDLLLDGVQALHIALGTDEYITIDCSSLDAYKGSKNVLKNRICTGNYENLYLAPGKHTISWEGQVDKIDIERYSRWI